MSDDLLIRAEHVSKKFCRNLDKSLRYGLQDMVHELRGKPRPSDRLRPDEFWSLNDVSFELRRGESLGLIGRNGAGKSTLLQLVNGRLKLDGGRITLRGTTGLVTELGAGFNPVQTGRENVYNSGAVLGLSRARIDELYGDIVEFAELAEAMDTPVQNYSAGMRARLGYAVVAHLKPDILMVDEVLAVGDVAFRRKCIQHLIRYLRSGGSLLLVAHDMYALQSICTRCLLLDGGRVLFEGPAVEGLSRYYEMMMALRAAGAAGAGAAGAAPGTGTAPGAGANMLELAVPPAFEAAEPTEKHPVVIERLSIRPPNGQPVETGASAIVEMHYRALRAIDGILWGFSIHTGDQLVRITSGLAGFDGRRFALKGGRGVLSCTIPKLPLVAGTYVLKGAILDPETRRTLVEAGVESPPTVFTVRSDVSEENNIRSILGNLVVIDVIWDKP